MSDDDQDQFSDQEEAQGFVKVNIDELRNLRTKAKTNDNATAERQAREAAERELAFIRAGVPEDGEQAKVAKLFRTAYTGDMSVDAIKAEWAEISGTTSEATPTTHVAVTEAEIQAALDRGRVSTGAVLESGATPAKPAAQRAVEAGLGVMQAGGTREDAFVRFGQEALVALKEGDRSMVVGEG